MSIITARQKHRYLKEGYLILKSTRIRTLKNRLKRDLKNMALRIIKNHPAGAAYFNGLKNKSFAVIFDWCIKNEKNNVITRAFYELFPVNFSTLSLIADPFFTEVSKSLGVSYPLPSTLPILRIDRPHELLYLTPAHQDYWYSMLSDNALTYWFPVFPVTKAMGRLIVVPGSHGQGILPIKKWTDENPFCLRDEIPADKYVSVNLEDDEVLVFSQFLVHQSGVNRSEFARLTLQVRHNDLTTLKEQTTSFTPKYSMYTAKAQKDWFEKSQIPVRAIHA